MRQSARTALSWLRATAARYGLDPAFQRDTGVICTCSWTKVPKEGVSAGETMAAALVSAFARRRLSTDDVAMTGEVTLGGQVLPAGGIAEKVLAARRGGLRRVLLAQRNRKQVDEDLGDDLRRVVAVDGAVPRSRWGNLTVNRQVPMPQTLAACRRRRRCPPTRPPVPRSRPGNLTVNRQVSMPAKLTARNAKATERGSSRRGGAGDPRRGGRA